VAHPLFGKTSRAIGIMVLLLAVPYLSPRLSGFRIVRGPGPSPSESAEAELAAQPGPTHGLPDHASGGSMGVGASPAGSAVTATFGETPLRASRNEATVTNSLSDAPEARPSELAKLARAKGAVAVEDASGVALNAFYKSLARTQGKEAGAVTRILHYGDSVITSDYVSGTTRRKLQKEFGDSGHGFVLIANPWEWYFHNDVSHGAGDGWTSSRITGPFAKDKLYGLGGVSFTGAPGATSFFGTAERGSYGQRVSRFDIYYLETPTGGDLEVSVGGKVEQFSSRGDETVSRVKSFAVPDGEAKLQLRVVSGKPRLFGVALERDQPGVVVDALGANGARAELLGGISPEHFEEQMALRKPALVVLQYGTNESEGAGIARDYESTLGRLVETIKKAAPEASILIAAPLDRAEASESGSLRTKPIIKRLVSAQRNVAKAHGVAFWNTFEAMGGDGAMAKWSKTGLGAGDLTHPTPRGAEVIGSMMSAALVAGFEAWRSPKPSASEKSTP